MIGTENCIESTIHNLVEVNKSVVAFIKGTLLFTR